MNLEGLEYMNDDPRAMNISNTLCFICRPILKNEPLLVNVEGLEYMNDDPGAVDVLYAKVQCQDGSDR